MIKNLFLFGCSNHHEDLIEEFVQQVNNNTKRWGLALLMKHGDINFKKTIDLFGGETFVNNQKALKASIEYTNTKGFDAVIEHCTKIPFELLGGEGNYLRLTEKQQNSLFQKITIKRNDCLEHFFRSTFIKTNDSIFEILLKQVDAVAQTWSAKEVGKMMLYFEKMESEDQGIERALRFAHYTTYEKFSSVLEEHKKDKEGMVGFTKYSGVMWANLITATQGKIRENSSFENKLLAEFEKLSLLKAIEENTPLSTMTSRSIKTKRM